MTIVQIEHSVFNFDGWKKAFDGEATRRQQSGMRRYQILRPLDNPNYAIIELEFDNLSKAETFLAGMRELWGRVEGTVIKSPQGRLVEVVESKEY